MRENNTQCDQTTRQIPQNKITQFEDTVFSFFKSFPSKTIFLAAVSGGADSMAMLAALCAVNPQSLFCLHVEHGLRPAEESNGDAEFVRTFCEKNGINYRIKHIPPGKIAAFARRKGIGIEAAARCFRHKALRKQAARLGTQTGAADIPVLIAHTKDDAMELALMRILRGCGPAGLAAMPKNRGYILRPLLDITRAEVIEYLKAKGIPWREDSTNTDEKFLRNRIRSRLTPLLNETFSSWKTGIAAMAETQSLAAEFISSEAQNRIKWEIKLKPSPQTQLQRETEVLEQPFWVFAQKKSEKFIFTEEANFFAQPEIIREEAIFQGINTLSSAKTLRTVKRAAVRRFCAGAVNAADLGVTRVRREEGKVMLSRTEKEFFESGVSLLIKSRSLG